jgi:HD-GYP domain-containing protein (c-di-GMP phosphodiesterase class II)
MSEERPALRGPARDGRDDPPPFAAAVVPLPDETGAGGVLAVVRTDPPHPFEPGEVDALCTLAALSSVSVRNADLRDAQRNFFSHVTEMLVVALDAHLGFNLGHCDHVAQLANRVGRALDLGDEQLQKLHFASLLHDIGMLKLDRNQQMSSRTCQKHPAIGYRMLKRIRLWRDLAPLVHHHHEWYDGSGYPEGLAGEEIPRLSRIIAICEAFDAMTNPESYKPPMSLADAREEVVRCTGTQFDPEIAGVFVRLIDDGVIEPAAPRR